MAEPLTSDFSQQWRDFTRFLRRRLWTILTFLTITALVVAAGTWMQTPVYQATATVLIDMETANVLSVSTIRDDSTFGQSNYQTYADYYRTQLEILTSRSIAERVFANLKLQELPPYASAQDPVAILMGQVTAEPVKQTRLAKLHAEDPTPQQAARLANEFAAVFAEENLAKTMSAEAMTLMKNEYLKLQSKEAELSRRYQAKHPAMIRVRQEMEQLAQTTAQEMKRQLHYERRQVEGGSPTAEAMPKSLLERLKESSVMGSLRPNNIRVQDLAQAPTTPSKPNKVLNLLLGLFLGLLGGIGMGALQELLDSSLKVPEDVEQDGRLVLLGYVPRMDGFHAKAKNKLQQRYQCVQLGPHSPAAEAYRALRTSLLYAAPHGNARAVVVTSPGAEEGKTTTVTNLGIALAQSGLKVLLVDADLRKGRLHNVFQLKCSPGLTEFLVGQASFETTVQPTGIAGLSVIASGVAPPNPAELLGSSQMRDFLKQATTAFDRVLLDSPPVIAVTDAAILAGMTETVVAVAQSGKTPRQAIHRLTAICQEVRAKVLGIVLNNVPKLDAPAYYRYSAYRYTPPHGDGRSKRS